MVHTRPRDWHSLAQVLGPAVERIDPLDPATQLLVVTPDVESTIALVAGAFAHFGVQGIDILPATGAARTARLLRTDPARAVAGPPSVLRELLASSTLRLDGVQTILFAWVDDLIEEGGEPLSDLEAVLAEAPRDAARLLLVRELTPAVERFMERHLHQGRRIGTAGSAEEVRLPVSYVATTTIGRPAALRRVLDELDPPSAAVVVRTDDSETEARRVLRHLGYRRQEDVVNVTRGEVPANTNTVVLYDTPTDAASFAIVSAAHPARVVALVEPREISSLRRLTGGRAVPLQRPAGQAPAQRGDERLRAEIRELLEAGFGLREVGAIEPLLAEFDAAEVAGALVRLVERERERHALTPVSAPRGDQAERRPAERRTPAGGRRGDRDRRPSEGRGPAAPRRDERDRRPAAGRGAEGARRGERDQRPAEGRAPTTARRDTRDRRPPQGRRPDR